MKFAEFNPLFMPNSHFLVRSVAVILLIITATIRSSFSQIPAKPFDNSRFITVDSVRIHFRSWNDSLKEPRGNVLLVHGFIGSTFCWRENTDTLVKQGYRVIAVDLPGFGFSDRNLGVNQSQSNRARILWDFLKILDSNAAIRWNLIGHSMGGGTVEAMATMHPERTRSLLIVDGMLFISNENMKGAFITLSKQKKYNQFFSFLIEKRMFSFNIIRLALSLNYGYSPDSVIVESYLQPLLIEGTAESVLSVWSNAKEIEHLNIEKLNQIPILVVWGKKDLTISLRKGKRFVRHVKNAELKVIPYAHHDPMETHPGAFNKMMIEFLTGNK